MPSRQVDEHTIVRIKPPPGEIRSDPYDKVLTPSRRFGFELDPGEQAGSQREDGHKRWQIVPVRNLETFSEDIP